MECIESKTLDCIIDKTFAVRLYEFINDTQVCDPMSEEERDYLMNVAKKLLKYQIETCKYNELEYYENIKDIVKNILGDDCPKY